jgi:hypothetical protein
VINSKWIKVPNLRSETLNLLKENIGKTLENMLVEWLNWLDCLSSKCEALSSKPRAIKNKQKKIKEFDVPIPEELIQKP